MARAPQGFALCPVIAGLLEHGFFHKLKKLTLLGGKDMLASEMSQMVSQRICVPVFSLNPGCAPIG